MTLQISATDTEVQHPINAVFQQTFLRQVTQLCPYLTGTTPTEAPKNAGTNTVKWRRVDAISPSTSALSEQTGNAAYMGGRSSATTSNTDVTATLSTYGQFVILTDRVDLYSMPAQVDQITKAVGICAGRSLNMVQRNVAEDNLTKVYAGGAASTGAVVSKITLAGIESVINTLVRNSAMRFTAQSNGNQIVGSTPILASFWGLCHPDVAYDISKLPGFKSVETYAAHTQVSQGEFGMIQAAGYGVRFIQSEDATVDADAGGTKGTTGLRGTSDVDIYTTVIYGMDALGSVGLGTTHGDGIFMADELPDSIELILKGRESGGTSDPLNEIQTVGYKFFHTGAVLNANWGRALISGATAL